MSLESTFKLSTNLIVNLSNKWIGWLPNGSPGLKSVYSGSLEGLGRRLLEDILNHINCQS